MNFLILGRGKTGSLVMEVARERKHHVGSFDIDENKHAAALTKEALGEYDVAIDFTTPEAALENIAACCRAGKNIVVGSTGWYGELPRIRKMVEESGIGFLYAGNFSVGVNLFYDVARTAAAALKHEYIGQIFERHHIHKLDAPSGTAVVVQNIVKEASGHEVEITSFREGEVVGLHELTLDSPNDTIYVCHDAKSRRGFAEGAVRAAEWLAGQKGFFDFKDVWREL